MSAPALPSSSPVDDDDEHFLLPSSFHADWTLISAALSAPIPDESALILTIRRFEHFSRTEGREQMPADPVLPDPAPGDSPRPFTHPPFPALCYFLRDHLGRDAQSIKDAGPAQTADEVAAAVKSAFFLHTLPAIQRIALRMPELFPSGRLHRLRACASPTGPSSTRIYSRLQVLCLVSHLFFCTLRRQCVSYWASYAPWFQWWKSDAVIAYLHTTIEYFTRRCEEAESNSAADAQWMQQQVVFKRAVLSDAHTNVLDSLASSDLPLTRLEILHHIPISAESSYPCRTAAIEIDFAHPSVSFGRGGTQEELLLGMSPETHLAPLLLDDLRAHESASIAHAQRVGTYAGYGCDVRYTGRWTIRKDEGADKTSSSSSDVSPSGDDPSLLDPSRSLTSSRTIVALDAANLWDALGSLQDSEYDSPATTLRLLQLQYDPATLRRDLCKAFVGLDATSADGLAQSDASSASASSSPSSRPPHVVWTGSWGCNSFGGDLHVKLLLQWIAASLSGVTLLRYQTFAEPSAFETEAMDLIRAVEHSQRATVSMLWNALIGMSQDVRAMDPASLGKRSSFDVDAIGKQLFDRIRQQLE